MRRNKPCSAASSSGPSTTVSTGATAVFSCCCSNSAANGRVSRPFRRISYRYCDTSHLAGSGCHHDHASIGGPASSPRAGESRLRDSAGRSGRRLQPAGYGPPDQPLHAAVGVEGDHTDVRRPDDEWEHAGKIALSFQTGGDLGSKETIRAPKLTVGYAGVPPILRDVTANIYRGDKVGIVGPNGSGKSTLLKTLIGELPPIAGKVEIGTGVRIGYFDQKLGTLDEDLSLVDEIRSVRADLSPEVIRQYLAKFRFFGDDPFRTVRGLSGGERSRLAMAKIMLFPRNVLVLDEPTNHLDIPARETLEDALGGYEGTLIVVSHDRYFLDRVCTRLLVIDGDRLEAHIGNYSDWRRRAHEVRRAEAAVAPPAPSAPKPASAAAASRDADKERDRERRRLARRVETLEADVSKLEAALAAVRAELGADHGGDWQKLHTLADRERELDALLAKRMAEWEAASAAVLNQSATSSD